MVKVISVMLSEVIRKWSSGGKFGVVRNMLIIVVKMIRLLICGLYKWVKVVKCWVSGSGGWVMVCMGDF